MKALTSEAFIRRAKAIHASAHYGYEQTRYTNAHAPVTIICSIHGPFSQLATNHLSGKGCPACRPLKASKTRELKTDDFVAQARKLHGDAYDYSHVNCHGVIEKIEIVCPVHGSFWQRPLVHLQKQRGGCGCPKCGVEKRSSLSRSTAEKFIEDARLIHGDQYDYSKVNYQTAILPIDIVCPKHGSFSQVPDSHLAGHGCPVCHHERTGDRLRHTLQSFIKKAHEVHGDKYSYDLKGYRSKFSYVNVICPIHGKHLQQAKNHLNGHGCPSCSSKESRPEKDLFDWVLSLCPTALNRDRSAVPPYELDIIVPELKIIVEFNGTYWHSNKPESKPDLRDYAKWKKCTEAGYRVFTVWEHDWNSKKEVIKHWLTHKLEKAPRLCGARKTTIGSPTPTETREFYSHYHLQGPPAASSLTIGLKLKNQWVAMASFSKSAERNCRLPDGEFYFSRLAFAGSVPGAASKLLKAMFEKSGAKKVHAHSDNSYADGDVKKLLGFEIIGSLPPRYKVWHQHYGIKHRTFWQKSKIPVRLKELGITADYRPESYTVFAGHSLCKCRHVWDCGKTRWLWTKPT